MNTELKDNKKFNYKLWVEIGLAIILFIAIIMIIFSGKKNKYGEIVLEENLKMIYLGEKKKIDAQVRNYSDAVLSYKSGDENIIKVDNDTIEGINVGKTSITISCNIKDVKPISFEVLVKDGGGILNSISYPLGELVIGTNKTFDLNEKIVYNPSNGVAKSKTFVSSNPEVAEISPLGVLTTKKVGITNITTNVNSNHNSTITVFVVSQDNPGEIIMNTDKIIFKEKNIKIKKGDTKKIEYDISPKESSMKYVSINIENKNIVSINEDIVKGLNVGKTAISYKTIDNKEYKINIEVIDDAKILNNDITMEINTTKDIEVGIDDKNLKVSVDDSSIISAEYKDKVLKISAKKIGATIVNIENSKNEKNVIKVSVIDKNNPTPTPIIIEERNLTEKDYENRGYSIATSTKNLNRTYDNSIKEGVNHSSSVITFTAKNDNLNIIVCDYFYGNDKCDINNGIRLKDKEGTYELKGYGMHVINVYEDGKVLIPYYVYLTNPGYTVNNLYSTKDLALNSSIKTKTEIVFNITDDKINKLLVCWTDENSDCDPLTEVNTVKPITKINNKLYLNNPNLWKVKVLELDSDNKKIKDADVYYVSVIE